MVKRTFIFFISLLLACNAVVAQDTITLPLNIRAGFDLSGPLVKLLNNNLISYGAAASVDYNENITFTGGFRYTSFSSSEVTYDFNSRGLSFVAGVDHNFIKPKTAAGKYYAGIGIRYGISFYGQETPRLEYTNDFGTGTATLPLTHHTGHYLEVTPGVRTELFPGVTIGWNIYMRILLSSGTRSGTRPVWMPGYGAATSSMTTGAEYYVSISLPFRKKRIIIQPSTEEPEEEEPAVNTTGQ